MKAAFARPCRIMGLARFAPVRAARPPPRVPPRPPQGGRQQLFATMLPCHSWRAPERARMHGLPCCWRAAAHWRRLAPGRRAPRRTRRGAAGGAAGAARGGRPDGAGLPARRQRARAARAGPRCAAVPMRAPCAAPEGLLCKQALASAPHSSTSPPSRSLRSADHSPPRAATACPARKTRIALCMQIALCCLRAASGAAGRPDQRRPLRCRRPSACAVTALRAPTRGCKQKRRARPRAQPWTRALRAAAVSRRTAAATACRPRARRRPPRGARATCMPAATRGRRPPAMPAATPPPGPLAAAAAAPPTLRCAPLTGFAQVSELGGGAWGVFQSFCQSMSLPVFRADVACALGVAARHPFDSEHAFSRTPHGCRCLCKEKGCGCSGRGEAGSCARGMAIGCHDEPGAWRSSAMAAWSDPSMPPHAQSPDNGGGDGSDSTPAPRRRPRAGSPLLPSDGTGPPLGTSASGNSTPAAADGGDAGAGGAAWADAPVPSRGRRSGPGRWRPGLLRAHADEVPARGAGRVALPWWKPAINMQTLPPPCRASFAVNLGPVHKTGWILR